jgi:hypothetical protein
MERVEDDTFWEKGNFDIGQNAISNLVAQITGKEDTGVQDEDDRNEDEGDDEQRSEDGRIKKRRKGKRSISEHKLQLHYSVENCGTSDETYDVAFILGIGLHRTGRQDIRTES